MQCMLFSGMRHEYAPRWHAFETQNVFMNLLSNQRPRAIFAAPRPRRGRYFLPPRDPSDPATLPTLPTISSPSSLSISESPVRSPTTYPRSLPSFPPSLLQSSLLTYILPSRPSLPHSLPSCISPSLPSTIAFLSLCLARKICPFLNGKICPLDNGKICPLSVGLARKICPFSSQGVKTGTFRFAASGV